MQGLDISRLGRNLGIRQEQFTLFTDVHICNIYIKFVSWYFVNKFKWSYSLTYDLLRISNQDSRPSTIDVVDNVEVSFSNITILSTVNMNEGRLEAKHWVQSECVDKTNVISDKNDSVST
jgi:hypothetical protein